MSRLGKMTFYIIWPGLFFYMRIGSRTRTAIIVDDEVLLLRGTLSDGRWGLPGGGRRRSEPLATAAQREIGEETGIVMDAGRLEYLHSESVRNNGFTYTCHFFMAQLAAKPNLRLPAHEIAAAEWVKLADVATLSVHCDVTRALQLVAERG